MNKYLMIINETTLKEYSVYYFNKYPKRRVLPIKNPIPPSLNQWMVMTRFEANKVKQDWKEFIIWLVDKYNLTNKNIEKAIVTYSYYFRTKARHDSDNYNGKFTNDGLVESGLLVDDDFGHVKMMYEGYYDKNNPRTEILIEVVDKS